MNYSAFNGKKFWLNMGHFALYMALIILTPYVADLTAPWFIQISYNQLTPFLVEFMLAIIWLLEIHYILLIKRIIRKVKKYKAPWWYTLLLFFLATLMVGIFFWILIGIQNFVVWKRKRRQAKEEGTIKKEKKERPPVEVLPLWKLLTVTGIVIGCLVVVGLQIGLEVKLFYDVGQRVTSIYGYMSNFGPIVLAPVKCLWTILILKAALGMGEAVFGVINAKKLQSFLIWAFATVVLFTFGLYEIIAYENKYALTYVLFYLLFPLLYALMEKNDGKYYLVILFIYIF